jgi:hypothetical protein
MASTSSGASRRKADHARRISLTPSERIVVLRRRVHRQLRMLFIYPFVYMIMWIIPFVLHCMQYTDYYATHPPFALSLLSTVCLDLMGLVDCILFGLREKPWKHIRNGDRTFWGSFLFWRGSDESNSTDTCPSYRLAAGGGGGAGAGAGGSGAESDDAAGQFSDDGDEAGVGDAMVSSPISPAMRDLPRKAKSWWRWGTSKTPGHSNARNMSDAQKVDADRAYERLAREQADRRELRRSKETTREGGVMVGRG